MASDPCDDARLLAWLAAPEHPPSGDVASWAAAALGRVCPIGTGLLAFDQRLESEVAQQLAIPASARSVEEWGLAFARRLTTDPDPWISWAAQVDAGTLDPSCPGDPGQAILLITAGTDPRV